MLENISRDPVLLLVYVHVGLRPGWGAQTSKAKDLVSNRGFNNLDSPTIPHLHKATSPAHAFRWPQAHSGPDLLPRCDHGVGFHSAASSPSAPLRSTPRAQNSSLPSASSPPANLQRQPPRPQKNVRFDISQSEFAAVSREEQGSGQQVGRSSERITLTHTHHGGVGRGNEVDGAEDSAAEGEEPSVRSAHTAREPGASIEEENGPRADLTVLPPAYPPPPPPVAI